MYAVGTSPKPQKICGVSKVLLLRAPRPISGPLEIYRDLKAHKRVDN